MYKETVQGGGDLQISGRLAGKRVKRVSTRKFMSAISLEPQVSAQVMEETCGKRYMEYLAVAHAPNKYWL
jgi:hypothetical protein